MKKNDQTIKFITTSLFDSTKHFKLENYAKSLNWNDIFLWASLHQVTGALYKKSKTIIPKNLILKFKNEYLKTTAMNLIFLNEYYQINKKFRENNIKNIPLKGLFFIMTLCDDLGIRPMLDLDIMINENDLEKAKNILLQLGYKVYLNHHPEWYWRKYHHHIAFLNNQNKILVELHWTFAPPRTHTIDLSQVWENTKEINIGNNTIQLLTNEDNLINICMSICKQPSALQFIPLKTLIDIELLVREITDIKYLINQLENFKLQNSIYYLYLLTNNFFSTPWPTELIIKLKLRFSDKFFIKKFSTNQNCLSRLQSYFLIWFLCDTPKEKFLLVQKRIISFLEKTLKSS